MTPYVDTNHLAGLLFLTTISAWGMMELSQRSQPQRQGATRIGGVASRLFGLALVIAGAVVVNVTPHVVPGAAIRPGAVAFAAGLVILLAALGDRYRAYAAQHKRLVPLIWRPKTRRQQ